jgi:hypothetical protein
MIKLLRLERYSDREVKHYQVGGYGVPLKVVVERGHGGGADIVRLGAAMEAMRRETAQRRSPKAGAQLLPCTEASATHLPLDPPCAPLSKPKRKHRRKAKAAAPAALVPAPRRRQA